LSLAPTFPGFETRSVNADLNVPHNSIYSLSYFVSSTVVSSAANCCRLRPTVPVNVIKDRRSCNPPIGACRFRPAQPAPSERRFRLASDDAPPAVLPLCFLLPRFRPPSDAETSCSLLPRSSRSEH